MENIINKIAGEWVYRVGQPDIKMKSHLIELINILKEYNWPEKAITQFITNILLTESELIKVYLKKGENAPKNKKIKIGPRGGKYFLATKGEKEDFEKNKNINRSKNIEQPKKDEDEKQEPTEKHNTEKSIDVDSHGNYIPSEEDKKIVYKSLKNMSPKIGMLASDEDKKILQNFETDIEKLINTRDQNLAKEIVNKYKLSTNKDPEIGKNTKLYIGAISHRDRKIFSGGTGNLASSVVAKILTDLGALGPKKAIFTKKSLTPNKIFKKEKTIKLKESSSGHIEIGNHKIYKAKNYNYDTLKQLLITKKNVDVNEADNIVNYIKSWVNRHNYIIDNIKSIIKDTEINVLSVCDECDMTTDDGINKTKTMALQQIMDLLKEKNKTHKDPDLNRIINKFSDILETKDRKEFEEKLKDIVVDISSNEKTTESSADIIEVIDYIRVLNSGNAAILPAQDNFPLGDLIVLPKRQPTIEDILNNNNNLDSIFVSLDNRSVKKGVGGASASKDKIQLTKFKNDKVKDDLMKIVNNYSALIHEKNVKEADNIISYLENKYKYILDSDESYKKSIGDKKRWIEVNSNKLHDVQVWDRYYKLGYMLQSIYNNTVDFQAFKNSKYIVSKNSVRYELTDGINKLALLQFTPSNINNDGKPNNTYPTRFIHLESQ